LVIVGTFKMDISHSGQP